MIDAQAKVQEHGVVRLQPHDRPSVTVHWAHARGLKTVGDVTAALSAGHVDDSFNSKPRVVVVDGALAAPAAPMDLVRPEDSANLVRGSLAMTAIDMSQLRQRYAAGASSAVLQELSA